MNIVTQGLDKENFYLRLQIEYPNLIEHGGVPMMPK